MHGILYMFVRWPIAVSVCLCIFRGNYIEKGSSWVFSGVVCCKEGFFNILLWVAAERVLGFFWLFNCVLGFSVIVGIAESKGSMLAASVLVGCDGSCGTVRRRLCSEWEKGCNEESIGSSWMKEGHLGTSLKLRRVSISSVFRRSQHKNIEDCFFFLGVLPCLLLWICGCSLDNYRLGDLSFSHTMTPSRLWYPTT